MKSITTIVVASIAIASIASGAEYIEASGAWLSSLPGKITTQEGAVITPVTLEDFIANGGHVATEEEIAVRDYTNALAQEQSEEMASLPAQFANGVAVTNSAGHWVKFIPDGTNAVAETIAIQISNSPPDPETAAQMEAEGLALHESKKSASRAKIAQAKSQAAAANSVPALRAAVAKIIEALEE